MRLLIIEDERPMRTALADRLTAEGYRVITANDGVSGLERALSEKPDLILLDVMMPQLDGFSLAAELRRLGRPTPILMLTAKGQVEDRVRGLDSGADDYLVKPFSGDELLARVRAVLRRFDRTQNSPPERLALGNVQVDFVRQEATRNGRPLHLTGKEFAILRLLAETPGQPVSRETFLDRIWGVAAFPTTRTVDTHMSALRAKLERNPNAPSLLTTVHGLGYKLNLPNSQNPDKSHRGSAQAEPGNTSL
ncbi:MAG TPA: response regulator transcription factor [Verrucomicrobiota bacterium]|nr:response regulator transcription factor [Verrucomicrobiota bacterium]